jgi:hypothetical protein
VREAAEKLNLNVNRDPRPDLVFFIRSDQYSFVKQGIPSVFSLSGVKSDDPDIKPAEIIAKWRKAVNHQPQDDMNQPFDFRSGAKFAQYSFLVGYGGVRSRTHGGVAGCVKKTRRRHAVRKMKVGPSEPLCRGRLQTAVSCFSQKLRW